MCNDVLKLDFDRWHVDILCDPMQPSWHIEGNPDTDSLPWEACGPECGIPRQEAGAVI